MRQTISILIIIYIVELVSCDRIRNKGEEIANKTENKIKSKSVEMSDKVFPIFDSEVPDTKFNKRRFEEYLEVEISEDVDSIYAFGDFLGADYKILFSFKCSPETIDEIVKRKGMAVSEKVNDGGLMFSDEFQWWDKGATERIQPYCKIDSTKSHFYLWYDSRRQKAYYEQFSL
jgi:hypothetical protein